MLTTFVCSRSRERVGLDSLLHICLLDFDQWRREALALRRIRGGQTKWDTSLSLQHAALQVIC
jgi:hypothetical protein